MRWTIRLAVPINAAGMEGLLRDTPGLCQRSERRVRWGEGGRCVWRARGTLAVNGKLLRENSWEITAAWKAVVQDGLAAEWRVYCNDNPARKIMVPNPAKPGS